MIAALVLAAATFSAPVEVGPSTGPWTAAAVPGWLERTTSGNLQRVRLLDAGGREVPYRLLDVATDLSSQWLEHSPLNLRATADGFAFEIERPDPTPVDALEIRLDGDGGVLSVEITGGEPAGVLAADARVGRLQGVTVERVDLPITDAARIEVRMTTLVPGLRPVGARLHRTLRPRRSTARGLPYRAARVPGDRARDRWRLAAIGDVKRIDGLTLEIRAPAVLRRTVTVSAADDDSPRRVLGRGEVARLPLADGRRGISALRIPLAAGAWASVEVEIERGGEASVELAGALGVVARRWIVFPHPGTANALRLVSGDALRSDTLERGSLPVHPDDAAAATIGAPVTADAEARRSAPAGPSVAISLLFVAAAALLGVLAWRVLR